MLIEIATANAVVPDVSIDGLMADGQDTVSFEPSGDLLWAPILSQERNDEAELPVGEVPPSSGLRAAGSSGLICLVRIVAPPVDVSFELAADGRPVASQIFRDLRVGVALRSEGMEHIPLL